MRGMIHVSDPCPSSCHRFPATRTRTLREHRQGLPLLHDLTGERRPGRSRQLDVEVGADQLIAPGDQDGLEVTGSCLEQLAFSRELLHEHLYPLAQPREILTARDGS